MDARTVVRPPGLEAPIDLSCASCGYNLHASAEDGVCPECALSVRASRVAALRAARAGHRRMARGLTIVAGAWIASVAVDIATRALVLNGQTSSAVLNLLLAVRIASLAVTAVWLVGWFIALSRRAGRAFPTTEPNRRHLRTGIMVLLVARLLAPFAWVGGPLAFTTVGPTLYEAGALIVTAFLLAAPKAAALLVALLALSLIAALAREVETTVPRVRLLAILLALAELVQLLDTCMVRADLLPATGGWPRMIPTLLVAAGTTAIAREMLRVSRAIRARASVPAVSTAPSGRAIDADHQRQNE